MYETSGQKILQSSANDILAACFATRSEPSGWRGGGGWTGEKAKQGGESEAGIKGRTEGGRKRRSAPLYSIISGISIRLWLTREE